MKISFRNTMLAATVLAAGIAAQASAAPLVNIRDDVGLQGDAALPGGSVFAFAPATGRISLDGGSNFTNRSAGAFGLQKDIAGAPIVWSSFMTYCFEITQTLSIPTTYDAQLLAGATSGLTGSVAVQGQKAAAIETLWKARFAEATTDNTVGLTVASSTKAERSAAFQLALWEISTDNNADGADAGSDGLGEGTVRASRSLATTDASQRRVYDLAVAYLAIAYGGGPRETMYSLLSGTSQDLLLTCSDLFGPTDVRCGGPGETVDTPVPASLVLFGAGLMALAGMRRRKA